VRGWKNEKHFFDIEACQLTVGHETSHKRIWNFPRSKKCPSTYYVFQDLWCLSENWAILLCLCCHQVYNQAVELGFKLSLIEYQVYWWGAYKTWKGQPLCLSKFCEKAFSKPPSQPLLPGKLLYFHNNPMRFKILFLECKLSFQMDVKLALSQMIGQVKGLGHG